MGLSASGSCVTRSFNYPSWIWQNNGRTKVFTAVFLLKPHWPGEEAGVHSLRSFMISLNSNQLSTKLRSFVFPRSSTSKVYGFIRDSLMDHGNTFFSMDTRARFCAVSNNPAFLLYSRFVIYSFSLRNLLFFFLNISTASGPQNELHMCAWARTEHHVKHEAPTTRTSWSHP
jgi:hypothetical protein